MIEETLAGQAFQAEHVSTFGDGSSIGGRYVGAAHGTTRDSTVKCIIDANNIVMAQVASTGRSGGYGTVMAPTAPSTTYNFTQLIHRQQQPHCRPLNDRRGVFRGSFTTSDGTYTVTSFNQFAC